MKTASQSLSFSEVGVEVNFQLSVLDSLSCHDYATQSLSRFLSTSLCMGICFETLSFMWTGCVFFRCLYQSMSIEAEGRKETLRFVASSMSGEYLKTVGLNPACACIAAQQRLAWKGTAATSTESRRVVPLWVVKSAVCCYLNMMGGVCPSTLVNSWCFFTSTLLRFPWLKRSEILSIVTQARSGSSLCLQLLKA